MRAYRARKGPAARTEALGSQINLLTRFANEIPHRIGRADDQCSACGAHRWKIERTVKDANRLRATYGNCCQHGAVELPMRYFSEDVEHEVPEFYHQLLTSEDDGKLT